MSEYYAKFAGGFFDKREGAGLVWGLFGHAKYEGVVVRVRWGRPVWWAPRLGPVDNDKGWLMWRAGWLLVVFEVGFKLNDPPQAEVALAQVIG